MKLIITLSILLSTLSAFSMTTEEAQSNCPKQVEKIMKFDQLIKQFSSKATRQVFESAYIQNITESEDCEWLEYEVNTMETAINDQLKLQAMAFGK